MVLRHGWAVVLGEGDLRAELPGLGRGVAAAARLSRRPSVASLGLWVATRSDQDGEDGEHTDDTSHAPIEAASGPAGEQSDVRCHDDGMSPRSRRRTRRRPRPGAARRAGRGDVHLRRRRRPARYDGAARAGAQRDDARPSGVRRTGRRWRPWSGCSSSRPRSTGPTRTGRSPGSSTRSSRAACSSASGGEVRALLDCRPYADDDHDWWVVSDLTPGLDGQLIRVAADHVLGRQPRVDLAGPADRPRAGRARARPRHRLRRPGAAPLRPRRRGGRHRREPARPRRHRLQRSPQRRPRRRPRRLAVGAGRRRAVRPGHHQPAVRDLARDRRARSSTATPACPATRWSRRSSAGRRPTSPTAAGARSWPTGPSRPTVPGTSGWPPGSTPAATRSSSSARCSTPRRTSSSGCATPDGTARPATSRRTTRGWAGSRAQGIEGIGFGWINLRRGGSARELLDWPHAVEQPIAPAIRDWGRAVRLEVGLDDRLVTRADVQQETVGAPGCRGSRVDRAAPADRAPPRPPRRHGRGRAGGCLRRRADGRADPRRRSPTCSSATRTSSARRTSRSCASSSPRATWSRPAEPTRSRGGSCAEQPVVSPEIRVLRGNANGRPGVVLADRSSDTSPLGGPMLLTRRSLTLGTVGRCRRRHAGSEGLLTAAAAASGPSSESPQVVLDWEAHRVPHGLHRHRDAHPGRRPGPRLRLRGHAPGRGQVRPRRLQLGDGRRGHRGPRRPRALLPRPRPPSSRPTWPPAWPASSPASRSKGARIGARAAAAHAREPRRRPLPRPVVPLRQGARPRRVAAQPRSHRHAGALAGIAPPAGPPPAGARSGAATRSPRPPTRADYDEVRRLGSVSSVERSPDQTATALFFNSNSATMVGDALIRHLETHPLDLVRDRTTVRDDPRGDDRLRDPGLGAQAGRGLLAAEPGDRGRRHRRQPRARLPRPGGRPLVPNPNYSDYVSGHAGLTGPACEVIRRTLGEDTALELRSVNSPTPRVYAPPLRDRARRLQRPHLVGPALPPCHGRRLRHRPPHGRAGDERLRRLRPPTLQRGPGARGRAALPAACSPGVRRRPTEASSRPVLTTATTGLATGRLDTTRYRERP